MLIYVSSGSGADTQFVPEVTCDDVAALHVEIRSSKSVPHIARFLSIQDISHYLIPLIPKSFSLCNFIPLSQLAVFKSPPYSEDIDPLPVEMDVLILSNDLPPSSGEDLVSSVPQVLVVDEVVQPCDLLPPPNDEWVLMNSLTPEIPREVVVDAQPQAWMTRLGMIGTMSSLSQPSPELEVPLIYDNWGIVTANCLDELATCYEIQSSRFVLQEYILLHNLVEIPYDGPHRPRRGKVPTREEQDCWEVVTLYTIYPGVVVIKIELEIITSDYFICHN